MNKPSLFKEYLKLTLKGLVNFDKIVAARFNEALRDFGKLSPEKKTVAESRFQICLECPFNSSNAKTSPEFTELLVKGELALEKNPARRIFKEQDFQKHPPHYFTNRSAEDIHCVWCGCPIDQKPLSMDSACGLLDYNVTYNQNESLKWDVHPS